MNAESEDYAIKFIADTATLTCSGSFRMHIADFIPVQEIIMQTEEQLNDRLVLDIRTLESLNSSGINVFSRLTINLRKRKNFSFVIKTSKTVPWHPKLIKNLRRLMPSLTVDSE